MKIKKKHIIIAIALILLAITCRTCESMKPQDMKDELNTDYTSTKNNTNYDSKCDYKLTADKQAIKIKSKHEKTDLELVKRDFENCNDTAEVIINKIDETLTITIYQDCHAAGMPLDFHSIAQYTDLALDNIKSDIKILDIAIIDDKSKVHAMLEMNKRTDYFSEKYIMERMD